jgi:hypothetical protein
LYTTAPRHYCWFFGHFDLLSDHISSVVFSAPMC